MQVEKITVGVSCKYCVTYNNFEASMMATITVEEGENPFAAATYTARKLRDEIRQMYTPGNVPKDKFTDEPAGELPSPIPPVRRTFTKAGGTEQPLIEEEEPPDYPLEEIDFGDTVTTPHPYGGGF